MEVTQDEMDFILQQRSIFTEIIKDKTYSSTPKYLKTRIETPDKIIEIDNHPRTTDFSERSKKQSKDTIRFGTLFDGQARLDFLSYPKFNRIGFYIYLKGHRFWVDKDNWRKLFRLQNRTGAFLGVFKGKNKKKRRKKRP